jgi:hypothetical protein
VSSKTKHAIDIFPINCTRKVKICVYTNETHTNILSSFHYSHNWKYTLQQWNGETNCGTGSILEYYSAIKRKEYCYTILWVNPQELMLSEKNPIPKGLHNV